MSRADVISSALLALLVAGCAIAPAGVGASSVCACCMSTAAGVDAGPARVVARERRDFLTNGRPIANSRFPAVKKLVVAGHGVCSGTFIRPRVLLTAAHCVEAALVNGKNRRRLDLVVDGVLARRYAIQTTYQRKASGYRAYDVALVSFDRDFPSAPLAARSPRAGEPVTIVGFGMAAGGNRSSVGLKREGSNLVKDILWGQILVTAPVADTENSVILSGDSGGALFSAANEVLGVAARALHEGTSRAQRYSSYIDVNAQGIREFIASTIAGWRL